MFDDLERYRATGEALRLVCAFFWSSAYILVIRRGNKDKIPAMPLAAMALNICWEFIFAFVYMPADPKVTISWGMWFVLDVFILVQWLRYGGRDFPELSPRKYLWPTVAAAVLAAFAVLMGFTQQFGDRLGWFAGFLMNLAMSALFVAMLVRRKGVRGQSLYIALAKLLGTFVAFLLAIHWAPAYGPAVVDHQIRVPTPMPPLVVWVYPPIFALDLLYAVLVYRRCVADGINPWRRW
jgi:hypothetical protein